MRVTLLSVLLILALPGLLCAAKKDPRTTGRDYFRFGMEQAEAEKVLAGANEDWRVFYRLDATDSLEIALGWRGVMFYQLKFYEGRCYYIEKRAEATRDEVTRIIDAYTKHYGTTHEATESRDRSVYFARWSLRDREVTLSANKGRSEVFKLFYEEFDPLVAGTARRSQESQLRSGGDLTDLIGRHGVPGADDLAVAAGVRDEAAGQFMPGDAPEEAPEDNAGDEADAPADPLGAGEFTGGAAGESGEEESVDEESAAGDTEEDADSGDETAEDAPKKRDGIGHRDPDEW